MKKIYLSILVLTGLFLTFGAEAQIKIGTNGATIAPSSLLELESQNQGLLLPRLTDTAAINALTPPNGMLIYLTKAPAVGLYVRKVTGWEYLTGSLGGNGNFSSLTVAGSVTAGSFSGPLNGNATSANTAINATNSANSAIVNDLSTSTSVYPTFVTSTPGNAQLRTATTKLSFIPNTGILTATGFVGPLTGDVTGNASSATNATNASNTDVVNDVASATVHYPTFVSATSGNLPQKTAFPGLTFVPSTGILSATRFAGPLTGNASSATVATDATNSANSAVTNDLTTPGLAYPTFVIGSTGNQPLRTGNANLTYRPSTGQLTASSFVGSLTGNVTGNATTATDAQNTVNIRVTNNNVNSPMYPTFVSGTAGPLPPSVNGNLSYIPQTGELTATTFKGALLGNASTSTTVIGNVAAVNGGTGLSTYSVGDILYASSPTTIAPLSIGTSGQILRVSAGGLPQWSAVGSGTVTNVSGTANRITIGGTPSISPTVDIAANYGGQTSITTLGTITAGTWNGATIGIANGGTGAATLPTGLLFGNGISPISSVTGPLGFVLTSTGAGTAPAYQATGGGDMILLATQTVTGPKTFGLNNLLATGTGGRITTLLGAPGVGAATVTLPVDGTIVNRDATETLLNKTLNSPILVTPDIGAAIGTSLTTTGNLSAPRLVSTIATGTSPFLVTSTTPVANLSIGGNAGSATTAINFTGNLLGDVTGTQGATVVSNVGTLPATGVNSVFSGVTAANNATAVATPARIVLRDGTGNFAANQITAVTFVGNLNGTASLATNVTTNANLTGPITSNGNVTSIASQTGTGSTFAMSVSPVFTGIPSATTATTGTNSNQIATTAFVQNVVGMVKLVDIAPTAAPSIIAGLSELEVDYTVPNSLLTGTVVVSPTTALQNGVGILSARVRVNGTIAVKYKNFANGSFLADTHLNITVINP